MFFVTELESKPTRNPAIKNQVCKLIFDKNQDKDRKEIAEKLGINKEILTHKKKYCFYTISPTKRKLAIYLGAVEILSNEVIEDSLSSVMARIEGMNND